MLTWFIVNGRLAAAEKVISDLSVESLSLSRTEALLGYPFDFTTAGAEEQDEQQLHEHRDNLSTSARAAAMPLAQLPDADQHREIVDNLRKSSTAYYTLQQIVRQSDLLLTLERLGPGVGGVVSLYAHQLTMPPEFVQNARKKAHLPNTSLTLNARRRF